MPTAAQYGALMLVLIAIVGFAAGTIALGFTPGVLVTGAALIIAPTTTDGLSWSAAAFQGALEARSYAADALQANPLPSTLVIVMLGYLLQWASEGGAFFAAWYLICSLVSGTLRLLFDCRDGCFDTAGRRLHGQLRCIAWF